MKLNIDIFGIVIKYFIESAPQPFNKQRYEQVVNLMLTCWLMKQLVEDICRTKMRHKKITLGSNNVKRYFSYRWDLCYFCFKNNYLNSKKLKKDLICLKCLYYKCITKKDINQQFHISKDELASIPSNNGYYERNLIREFVRNKTESGIIDLNHVPTIEEISTLQVGTCFRYDGIRYVQASSITYEPTACCKFKLHFTCSLCWDKYLPSGVPKKNAKRMQHSHGYSVTGANPTHRGAHCRYNSYFTRNEYSFLVEKYGNDNGYYVAITVNTTKPKELLKVLKEIYRVI